MIENFPTDNADVSLVPVLGYLLAMTETPLVHLLDPETLDTAFSIDITLSPNFPENLSLLTTTAHGHIDNNGDYWNMGSGLDFKEQIPEVVYFVWKIPNVHRNLRSKKMTKEVFLANVEFSRSFAGNSNRFDLKARYFHMFSGSEDFLGELEIFCKTNFNS